MTTLAERITVDSEICHGKPAIRGLRSPVELILELLSSGMSHAEILNGLSRSRRTRYPGCSILRGSSEPGEACGPARGMQLVVDARLQRRIAYMVRDHGQDAVHTLDLPDKLAPRTPEF